MIHAEPSQAGSGQVSHETASSRHRHSGWTIGLHWGSVLAIVVAAVSGLGREFTEDDHLRVVLLDIHKQAGLLVLAALALRLMVRFSVGMANHVGEMPMVLRRAAQLAHLALYAMLFLLPVLGLAAINAHAVQVSLFGFVALPSMVAEDADLADQLSDYHVWAAWALLFLVMAHASAACWHHLVRRDGVLVAMLPVLKRKGRSGPNR